jgi:hypothetical protein
LHTPEELLVTAESLLSSGDPKVRRAAVLEAITALETFVHRTVFGVLNRTMEPLLVKWLEKKTRMDFDSRLGTLTPFALRQPVDKESKLWTDYIDAKKIRNKVTHEGKRISRDEAEFVLDTVRKWLAYLGSTVEVSLALDSLKRFIESSRLPISSGSAGIRIVHEYFERSGPAIDKDLEPILQQVRSDRDKFNTQRRPDLVLTFGSHKVVVEVKIVQTRMPEQYNQIQQAMYQVINYVRQAQFTRGALVIFSPYEPPEPFKTVFTDEDGIVSGVIIRTINFKG